MRPTPLPLIIAALALPFAAVGPGTAVTGTWQSPAADVSPYGSWAGSAQVVMTPWGSATTLWRRSTSAPAPISAQALIGTIWGTPSVVSDPTSQSTNQALAGNSAGQMGAAWATLSGSDWRLVVATGDSDGWSAPATVPGFSTDEPRPVTAVDPTGITTVVWLYTNTTGGLTSRSVKATRGQGSFWSAATNLSNTAVEASAPAVGVDAGGAVTAIWTAGGEVHVRRFAGGSWQPLDTLDTGVVQQARIAVHPAGGVTALWLKQNGSNEDVRYALFDGTSWSGAATVSQPGAAHGDPTIAVDSAGVVTAAWRRYDGANFRIAAARMSGGSWTTPDLISPAGVSAGSPTVAAGPGGTALAAWLEIGTPRRVRAAWWSGTQWGTPSFLSDATSDAASAAGTPSVAVDPLGSAVAVWSMDAPARNVQAARFMVPPGSPGQPSVTAGDARVAVTWTAPVNDGGDAITSYTATASPGGRSCTAATTAGCTVDGLSNGTGYTVTVTATNAQGTGPASMSSAQVTPAGAPAPSPESPATPQQAGPQQAPGGSSVIPLPPPPRLAGALRVRGGAATTTGTVPRGATRIIQTATTGGAAATQGFLEMARAKRATGKCRVVKRKYTCRIKLTKGTWTVTTTARGKAGVVAKGVRKVRVR